MSLKEIWNALHYKMTCLGICEPEAVRTTLEERGWTFETTTLQTISSTGVPDVYVHTTPKTPEGVSTLKDDAAQARYNRERQQIVDQIFNRAPAP